ncbi:MAG: hotdog fold thioesterase [Sphingobacteriaceae bacterium]|nr:hotdog fold thioesterase [Sphingobacteriaceae bacterium]
MMDKDFFSQWLGIKILEVKTGFCKISMQVRKEMLNGFGIAHGGISYSFADSALAFASNSGGKKSVSIETSIAHIEPLHEGEEITAIAECVTESEKLGHYQITVYNAKQNKIALFKGMVYKTSKIWD